MSFCKWQDANKSETINHSEIREDQYAICGQEDQYAICGQDSGAN